MRLNPRTCVGLVIDLQERLMPAIADHAALLTRCRILLSGLQLLEVPLLLTEQYPKGLGPTLGPIRELLPQVRAISKTSFSCYGEPEFVQALEATGKKTVLILGTEAHVCVLQTVIDLHQAGYQPLVVVDCLGSRAPFDMAIALERMKAEGALLTTTESVLFELCGQAGTERFKALSRLIK